MDVFDNPVASFETELPSGVDSGEVVLSRGYRETTAQLAEEAKEIDSIDDSEVAKAMALRREDERRAKLIDLLEEDERKKAKAHDEADNPVPHYFEWCIVCSNL